MAKQDETAVMIEGLYNGIAYDLQKMKRELSAEMKSEVQELEKSMQNDRQKAKTEIIGSMGNSGAGQLKEELMNELNYASLQFSSVYEELKRDIGEKVDSLKELLTEKGQDDVDGSELVINEIQYTYQQNQAIFDALSDLIEKDVVAKLEEIDALQEHMDELAKTVKEIGRASADYDAIAETVKEKIIASLAERLDFSEEGLAEKVRDKLVELLKDKLKVDIDLDLDDLAERVKDKILACIPYPEEVDYDKITDNVMEKTESSILTHNKEVLDSVASIPVAENVDYTRIVEEVSDTVLEKLTEYFAETRLDNPGVDYDRLVNNTAEKVVECLPYPERVDYKRIEDAVLNNVENNDAFIDKIASRVAEKVKAPSCDMYLDEQGTELLAEAIAKKLGGVHVVEEKKEAPKTVVENVAKSEIAVSSDDESDDEMVDPESGLVVRLKKSFTAKLKQSDSSLKIYYSDIKNALVSYKRLNSTLSWRGDRFNLGRDTLAKIGIVGKTLCVYFALDPNDPELKQSIYHQRDVSSHKAYEQTPFLVKIKSDLAAKKAVRLVGILAEKFEAKKDEKYEVKDFTKEFKTESTQKMIDKGLIKVSKEKKIALNFN